MAHKLVANKISVLEAVEYIKLPIMPLYVVSFTFFLLSSMFFLDEIDKGVGKDLNLFHRVLLKDVAYILLLVNLNPFLLLINL